MASENAHQDKNTQFSQLGVSGTLGTADTLGTALTVPFSANPLTGAQYVETIGGASGYTEGSANGTLTGNVLLFRDTGGTLRAIGTANPLPVQEQYAPGYEDNVTNVAGILQRPVASSTYAPSEYTSFGAVAGTVAKSSAGNVYSVSVSNGGTSLRFFQLFNSSTAVPNGATPVASYPLAAASTAAPAMLLLPSSQFAPSQYMSTGVTWAISSTNGTLGTASVIAADHNIHIKYV